MTDPILDLWTRQESRAVAPAPAELADRDRRLRRRIMRRDLLEYGAGALVIAYFGHVALTTPERTISAAAWVIVGGILIVMRNLWQRRPRQRSGTAPESVRDHYRRELLRQRTALASVWRWYLGPAVPGMLAFFAAVGWETARATGRWSALGEAALLTVPVMIVFVAIHWLNRHAARSLDAEISALDRDTTE